MAGFKNNSNENVVAKKGKKNTKPFLMAGLILLGLALVIGLAWFFTGSFVLLRNSIYLAGSMGAAIAVGVPLVNSIKSIFAKSADKQNTNKRERTRQQERTQDRSQEMERVPTQNNLQQTQSTFEWTPIVNPRKNSNTPKKGK